MAPTVLREIQGLRGIGIMAVLLFNLSPKMFPNGYAGSDIFFVISGYLVARSLSSRANYSACSHAEFYFKRSRRLLPLFILPVILAVSCSFIEKAWLETTLDSYFAVAFGKMTVIWDREGPASLRSNSYSKDVYRRLWFTLEVQLYLVSPLIILLLESLKRRSLKISFLLLTCSLSFGLYYNSNRTTSWNCLTARFWQFGLGMIASIISDGPIVVSTSIYSTGLSMISEAVLSSLVMVNAQEIREETLRPLVTFSCFVLLVVQTATTKKILSSKLFTYFGDISYSLYLIQWSIILLFRPA